MQHKMGLYDEPFESMKIGRKTVEVRLNDEKRRKIKPGDMIEFTKVPGASETLTVEVLALRRYETFREMYMDIPAENFDSVGSTIQEMVENTYAIYSPEREKVWGTLAITVEVKS